MRARPRRPASIAAALSPCSTTGWRDVPSTYLAARHDEVLPYEIQRVMATRATNARDLDGHHFVIYERPAEIAAVLRAL